MGEFQVANGSIPETVERFMRERCGMDVVYRDEHGTDYDGANWEDDDRSPGWVLVYYVPTSDYWRPLRFDWPHDREPTLQEAIEAVMGQRG